MKKILPLTALLVLSVFLNSCTAIGDIFKTGMGVGIFIVVVVVIIIIFIMRSFSKKS